MIHHTASLFALAVTFTPHLVKTEALNYPLHFMAPADIAPQIKFKEVPAPDGAPPAMGALPKEMYIGAVSITATDQRHFIEWSEGDQEVKQCEVWLSAPPLSESFTWVDLGNEKIYSTNTSSGEPVDTTEVHYECDPEHVPPPTPPPPDSTVNSAEGSVAEGVPTETQSSPNQAGVMLSDDTTITFFADQKNVNKDKVYWGDNTTYAEADIEAYAGLITFDTHIDYDAPEGSVVVGQMRYDKLLDYERKFWWTPDTTKDLPTLCHVKLNKWPEERNVIVIVDVQPVDMRPRRFGVDGIAMPEEIDKFKKDDYLTVTCDTGSQ